MAEELEEHEKETVNISGAPTGHGSLIGVQRTAASRRRGQSTSEDGRARLQELCQELADAKSAEEDGKGCGPGWVMPGSGAVVRKEVPPETCENKFFRTCVRTLVLRP